MSGLSASNEGVMMGLVLLVLLVILLLGGAGFAVHLLWLAAVIVLAFWLVGFAMNSGRTEGRRGWYRW
jgi:hypothetical protein